MPKNDRTMLRNLVIAVVVGTAASWALGQACLGSKRSQEVLGTSPDRSSAGGVPTATSTTQITSAEMERGASATGTPSATTEMPAGAPSPTPMATPPPQPPIENNVTVVTTTPSATTTVITSPPVAVAPPASAVAPPATTPSASVSPPPPPPPAPPPPSASAPPAPTWQLVPGVERTLRPTTQGTEAGAGPLTEPPLFGGTATYPDGGVIR